MTRGLGSIGELKHHLKIEILPQGVPHRTVALPRQGQGALHRLPRGMAGNREVQHHAHEPAWFGFGALGLKPSADVRERVTATRQDVHEIDRHASGEGRGERRHW